VAEAGPTSWWRTLKLRDEITSPSGVTDETVASLYRVVYGQGTSRPLYAKASYYGRITHPTRQLTELLTGIAVRLGGGAKSERGLRVVRLDQGMGGGKSHACIGAWHLATAPDELAREDIGKEVFVHAREELSKKLPNDLNKPHAVVLSCDNMTPAATNPEQDGPWAFNLYERFLWRLFDGRPDREELYEAYKAFFSNKAKIAEAMERLDRPVLVIFDEILNYIGDGLEGSDNPTLIAQDMAFLRAITEAVNDVRHAAMIVVMISSEKDATTLRGDGEARRQDLEAYLQRNGETMVVNENADFTAILRRRLFEPVDDDVRARAVAETVEAFAPVLTQGTWQSKVVGALSAAWTKRFAEEVERAFPFHPQLMDMAEKEWANLSGYQQVRSTIKIFAATVHTLAARASEGQWAPLLIGPGDVPLSDTSVRDAVLASGLVASMKTRSNYRSIAQNDVVDADDTNGAARAIDRLRAGVPWQDVNPRAAERAATMIFLSSIVGSRGGSRRGASDPEVKAATMVPDVAYGYNDADAVVRVLTDAEGSGLASLEIYEGKGGQPRRYYLSTQQRLPMLLRSMRNSVTSNDRDEAIARRAKELMKRGPFAEVRFVAADKDRTHRDVLVQAELDKARSTRLVVLDPAMFTLGNGIQQPTMESVRALLGLGADKVPTQWASSLIFLVAAARSYTLARNAAANYVAYDWILTGPEVEDDEELATQATQERDTARKRLDEYVQRSFQHVLYLAQPDPTSERDAEHRTMDEGTLNGTRVWELLAKAQKAIPEDKFTGRALVHNLRDSDYERPLSELRDAFWNTPRLALLPGGESDLRNAIYEAVRDGTLRIVRQGDEEVVVDDAAGINLNAPTYKLARPVPDPEPEPESSKTKPDAGTRRGGGGKSDTTGEGDTDGEQTGGSSAPEKMLSFTVMKNLASDPDAGDGLAQIFRRLFDALDRGSVSYLQLSIHAQLPPEQAKDIVVLAEKLGIRVVLRDR
jgi:hypothetical protein